MPNRPHTSVTVRPLSIDDYAYELLREMAPTPKSYGLFVSALLLAEHARRRERHQQKMQRSMQEVGESVSV